MRPIFASLLLLAIMQSCKKNDTDNPTSDLPDTSSIGKNFLACRVNGTVQVYSGKRSIGSDNGVNYGYSFNQIGIAADDKNDLYDDAIYISLARDVVFPTSKTYSLAFEDGNIAKYINYKKASYPEYLADIRSGWIRFSRIDTTVAAGTFAFTAYLNGQPGADSVVITDGCFDIASN